MNIQDNILEDFFLGEICFSYNNQDTKEEALNIISDYAKRNNIEGFNIIPGNSKFNFIRCTNNKDVVINPNLSTGKEYKL